MRRAAAGGRKAAAGGRADLRAVVEDRAEGGGVDEVDGEALQVQARGPGRALAPHFQRTDHDIGVAGVLPAARDPASAATVSGRVARGRFRIARCGRARCPPRCSACGLAAADLARARPAGRCGYLFIYFILSACFISTIKLSRALTCVTLAPEHHHQNLRRVGGKARGGAPGAGGRAAAAGRAQTRAQLPGTAERRGCG